MARPIPPPAVIPPGATRTQVAEAIAVEMTRLHGRHWGEMADTQPEHAQFMLDQADVIVSALLNLGVLRAG